jgi:hypothetical protein
MRNLQYYKPLFDENSQNGYFFAFVAVEEKTEMRWIIEHKKG